MEKSLSSPVVSIVTPTLNQGEFIEETIRSVLEQDYVRIEYIVMDGGSADGTLKILRKYEDRLRWISEPDRGQSDAINKGWGMASGDILAWLNSDDMYVDGSVTAAIDVFRKYPHVGLVYGDALKVSRNGSALGLHRIGTFGDLKFIRPGRRMPSNIPQPTVFIRKDILGKVGSLDIDLHYAMDYDFFYRIMKISHIAYIPRIQAKMRLYFGTKSSQNIDRNWKEKLLVQKRYDKLWFLSNVWFRYLRYRAWRFLPVSNRIYLRRVRDIPRDRVFLEQEIFNQSDPAAK